MKQPTVCVGSPDAFSAKKRRYSSTAVGFPIRDDLSACLQGISATFPTWERARLACIYVRNLGICLHRTKNDLLDAILSPDQCAAVYAHGARHGQQNSHTAPLFVPAWLMGAQREHHANTTLATPCGASNFTKRQCNSLLVSLQLAWELLASLLDSYCRPIQLTLANHSTHIGEPFNSHWRTIPLTLANHCRPIKLTLANYSRPIQNQNNYGSILQELH